EGAQELSRRSVAERLVRPDVVVIAAPRFDRAPCVAEAPEPMLAQALVPEAPVEAFDERILDWFARLDEVQLDAFLVGPGVEGLTGELRAVVDDDAHGQTTLLLQALQDVDHSL